MAKKGLGKGLNSLFNEEDIEEVTSDITKSSEGDIKKVRMSLIEPNKKQPRRHDFSAYGSKIRSADGTVKPPYC